MQITPSNMIKRLPRQEFAAVFQKIAEKKKTGADIINLGQGNPDLPTPPHIVNALQDSAGTLLYHQYAPFRGFDFFKQSIADFYLREFGVPVNLEKEIALFCGGKTGLYVLSQCLLNPNDIALVPDPGYPEYAPGIMMANAEPHYIQLHEEDGFLPNLESIESSVLQKAKVLFLNYPNNPTGAVANKVFFEEAASFAHRHGIHVIHDFAYGSFHHGQKPVSFLHAPLGKKVGIELYSLSKTFNMAGWRIAFAIGNERIIQAVNEFQDHVFVSMFGGFQHAASVALKSDPYNIEVLRQTYFERMQFFVKQAKEKLGWEIKLPDGAFYLWAKIPDAFADSHAFSQYLLEHANVVVSPGAMFGQNGDRYVRISMVAPIEKLASFIDRIQALHLTFHEKARI
ncbi:aminotransferase class I/II-fold pyridoxal phosphate-dependent enzyme [Bacillus gobiensis]|uniref:aminotransferase class I/II-fold pyridoxal phosphate-dependent enzyme n=1 Tax=Bacillus gobiensis TaxID=1441095 RepID=UPI003D204CEF